MKKTLCILLCVLMLLPTVAMLSSCKKTGELELNISKKSVEINISDYKLVREKGTSSYMASAVLSMADALKTGTGVGMRPADDKQADVAETPDLEILVGATNRTETEKALKSVESNGFVIKPFENKIVIAGTNKVFTAMAVQYFIQNCIPSERTEGVISIPKEIVMQNVPMVELVNTTEESALCSIVYGDDYDDKTGNDNADDPSTAEANPDQVDLPVAMALSVSDKIVNLTKVKSRTLKKKTDSSKAEGFEIQVGIVARDSSNAVRATLDAHQYAIKMQDGNLVLAAWEDSVLQTATGTLNTILTDSVVTDESGKSQILLPSNLEFRGSAGGDWVTEFPKPTGEGISMLGAVDLADSSLGYYYGGSGISAEAYEAYCKTLTDAGYKKYSENSREGNIYRTYNSADGKHSLYVVHAAFQHAESEEVKLFQPTIRVISAPTSAVNLVNEDLLSSKSWAKITDTSITSIPMKYATTNFGMNYVIMLEDGSFIIFDGGGDRSPVHDDLYAVLLSLYRKARNDITRNPTKDDPITIAAWIMTHQHWDHYATFQKFCSTYAKQQTLKIEGFYANFVSSSEVFNGTNPDFSLGKKLQTYEEYTGGDMKYYKLHSGMKLYIRNAELEVLYTHEDLYPQRINYFNDSSTTVRFTFKNSDGGDPVTAVFGGDLYQKGSKAVRALFGKTIQSDIVQVTHHGYNGVEQEYYKNLAPELLLWPTSTEQWNSQTGISAASGNWYFKIDYYIANQLSSVKYIIVQDIKPATIFLTSNGIDYENVYNAFDFNEKLTFMTRNENPEGNYLIKK